MKILWFTRYPTNSFALEHKYNGCGWVSSLESLLVDASDITLGISFLDKLNKSKLVVNNISYFPLNVKIPVSKKIEKLFHPFEISTKTQDDITLKLMNDVIEDFKPDVIHIFGTEDCFGLVSNYTHIPIVIHLQGLLNPIMNALVPPGYLKQEFRHKHQNHIIGKVKGLRSIKSWESATIREKIIFKNNNHFLGRTDWDRVVSNLLSPDSKYFYCGEVLRDVFYQFAGQWEFKSNNQVTIVSVLSWPLYKGHDVVLQTASILKTQLKLDFEWVVFGVTNIELTEKRTKILHKDVNVKLGGVASDIQIKDAILKCNIFIHPSYIDNSPNTVCEAQLLGAPVVACNVGGLSTIIEDNETGLLVPSNDPYMLAYNIRKIVTNRDFATKLGRNAAEVSLKRHNKEAILSDLLATYKAII